MGDEFGSRSFEKYFQARKSMDYNSYVKAHFDVSGYFNNTFTCDNPSMLIRISNLMINALDKQLDCKQLPLPKLFVRVVDDDLIKSIQYSRQVDDRDVTQAIGRLLNFVMME